MDLKEGLWGIMVGMGPMKLRRMSWVRMGRPGDEWSECEEISGSLLRSTRGSKIGTWQDQEQMGRWRAAL